MSTVLELLEKVLPDKKSSCPLLLNNISTAEFLLDFAKIQTKYRKSLTKQEFITLKTAAVKLNEPHIQNLHQFRTQSSCVNLWTTSNALDQRLTGGFFPGQVVEITGAAGSGKTQLCLHTTAQCLLSTDCTVIYVDTSGDFTAARVMDLLSQKKELPDMVMTEILKRLKVIPLHDVYSLFNLLYQIGETTSEKTDKFVSKLRLMVVDSITMLLGSAVGSKLADTATLFSSVGRELRRVATKLKITILVINNTVTSDHPGQVKPALGFYWREQCHRRLTLLAYDQSSPDLFKFQIDN